MTKKQQESIDDMSQKGMICMTLGHVAEFLEKRLGKVNAVTIDFKKEFMKPYEKAYSDAQDICILNGAQDELAKLI